MNKVLRLPFSVKLAVVSNPVNPHREFDRDKIKVFYEFLRDKIIIIIVK